MRHYSLKKAVRDADGQSVSSVHQTKYYQTSRIETSDGHALTLFRSPSPLGERRGGRPVVLLPGLGSNRLTFGIASGQTLACALNAVGRDVWVVEFRGNASSNRLGVVAGPVDLASKLEIDLPRALEQIHEATGYSQVDLVGHSVGGLFATLYAAQNHASVGRIVTVCAPLDFSEVLGKSAILARLPARALARLSRRLARLPIIDLAKIGGPIPHLIALRAHFGRSSSDRHLRRRYLDEAVEDLAGTEVAQILSWVGGANLPPISPRQALAGLQTPTLVMGARDDRVVPVAQVKAYFEAIGAPDKRLEMVSRRDGGLHNYGHAGILIAADAKHDVYPSIVAWLSGSTTMATGARGARSDASGLALSGKRTVSL
jgi:pimeloyl-ACP methyl ester carboxylesterase